MLLAKVDGDAEDVRRLVRSLRGVGREQVKAMFARYCPLGELGAEAQHLLTRNPKSEWVRWRKMVRQMVVREPGGALKVHRGG